MTPTMPDEILEAAQARANAEPQFAMPPNDHDYEAAAEAERDDPERFDEQWDGGTLR